ncbi:DNA-binding transcriptional regulator, MarR family [Lentzea xinjiangensis]|uniref:DNA-binding transcriptional regulator, MarR family n=1 Tax=Lentzea xinjiangensis TaxID=402600 RepID=A0A1H9ICB7_9PSEU|nr:MarR family transcriptional regulator [Lentzea xinjiangensis]SEQ72162.1 DNA-binding transcriptional regulator, MarR family [Lentzea xinjiangensis]
MEDTPARLADKPSWLLTQLAVHAHRLASEGFGEAGARGYHFRVLAALDEFGVASQAELGRRCAMDRSDVVAAVTELAERGFVERTQDPQDRRRNMVTLTGAGQEQLRRLDRVLDQAQDTLLEPLAAQDRQTLTRLLTALLAHHRRG